MNDNEDLIRFIRQSIVDITDVPHTMASNAWELAGLLGALDAVKRFAEGSKAVDAWHASRALCASAGVTDKDVVAYIHLEFEHAGVREPSERELMRALADFWRRNVDAMSTQGSTRE